MGNYLKHFGGHVSSGGGARSLDSHWHGAQSKLEKMDPEWFRGKRVLDIGSHDGSMDLVLAARFGPKLLIGVEIDHKLATKAMKNMHECINNSEAMSMIHSELQKNKKGSAEESNE